MALQSRLAFKRSSHRRKRAYSVASLAFGIAALFLFQLLLCRSATPSAKADPDSRNGMVVAASPYAAQAGAEILEQGGNAVDAAVATAFALIVAEPGMSGLGGRTVMLVGRPGGRVEGLDGATRWPRKWKELLTSGATVDPPEKGWRQVAIPGTLSALAEANRRWGRKPLSDLIRPALYLARNGFLVSATQERLFKGAADDLRADPALSAIFLHPDGSPYRAGELLRQPELAHTLELIAQGGPDVFYKGEIARALVETMQQKGGYVSGGDLLTFKARTAVVDEIPYGRYRIAALDKPAMGRLLLWRLRLLGQLPHYTDSGDDFQALAEALFAQPPNGPKEESDTARRQRILSGDSVSGAAAAIAAHVRARQSGAAPYPASSPVTQTTHLVAADRNGMTVSLTSSLGPYFGAKVALPGYGITFAATMGYLGNVLPPGEEPTYGVAAFYGEEGPTQEPISSIVPTLVFDSAGTPIIAIGGAGSDQIPEVVFQTIHHTLDRGLTIQAALAAPRLSVHRSGGKTTLRAEQRGGSEGRVIIEGLQGRGFAVELLPEGQGIGRVHAMMRGPQGTWQGAPDPRWFGSAVSPVVFASGAQKRPPLVSPHDQRPRVRRGGRQADLSDGVKRK